MVEIGLNFLKSGIIGAVLGVGGYAILSLSSWLIDLME